MCIWGIRQLRDLSVEGYASLEGILEFLFDVWVTGKIGEVIALVCWFTLPVYKD